MTTQTSGRKVRQWACCGANREENERGAGGDPAEMRRVKSEKDSVGNQMKGNLTATTSLINVPNDF